MPAPKDFIWRGPPLQPLQKTSLGEHFVSKLVELGDKVALINAETGEQVTFAEILEKSRLLACGLSSRGLRKGKVVAICSENSLDYCLPVLASLYLGAVCAPISSACTVGELEHSLSLMEPDIVFCSESTEGDVSKAIYNLRLKALTVVLSPKRRYLHHETLPLLLASSTMKPFKLHHVEDPAEEIAFIFSSSGTTGLPKGVMLTHSNLLSLLAMVVHPAFKPQDEITNAIAFMPFFHVYGMLNALVAMEFGATLLVMSYFNPETFLRVIQDYKIESCAMVPPIVSFLAKHPMVDDYDVTSLKRITVGAAPMSAQVMAQLLRKMPHIEIIKQGYGLTEAPISLMTPFVGEAPQGTIGIIAPGMESKVIHTKTGHPLGAGRNGELCFRGCAVMKGYKGNPAATTATIDSAGWLHTGDIGFYDERGFFYIVDRMKELIKYKGQQVAPAELEAVLMSHPGVEDAGVVGVPDERAGEIPRAYVVKQDEVQVTEEELVKFVEERVSPIKRLRGGVTFVDQIPKNPSGKILRRELREIMKSKL